jgi:hypothetical protein
MDMMMMMILTNLGNCLQRLFKDSAIQSAIVHILLKRCTLTVDETNDRYMDADGQYSCERHGEASREHHLHGAPPDISTHDRCNVYNIF